VEGSLSAEDLQNWIARLGFEEEVHVALPRFSLDRQIDLKATLTLLGMPRAFGDQAEFPGISTEHSQQLYDAIHRATVDVNEEGTEATAVSGGIGGNMPGPVPHPIYFTADHPFLFCILDRRSGAVLFLGRIVDPS
jgi:serpin B